MVTETKVKVGGAWKAMNTVQVKVAGVWKTVSTIEAKVAGVWKKVFDAVVICTAGTSAIPALRSDVDSPAHAQIGAKWDPDGGVYYYEDTTGGPPFPGSRNGGTWIGNCANTEYDGRWVLTVGGPTDEPTDVEPAKDVWRQMSIGNGVRVEWDKSNGLDEGTITFELRRRSDNQVILTDPWDFFVEVCTGK